MLIAASYETIIIPMEPWVYWALAGIVFVVVEMATPTVFFFLCFGLGALITSVLAYFDVPRIALWINFFASSVALILVARPIAAKLMKGQDKASNVDELIGSEAVVMEPIAPHQPGTVKVRGQVWRAESPEAIAEGSVVQILKVDGTRLSVTRRR